LHFTFPTWFQDEQSIGWFSGFIFYGGWEIRPAADGDMIIPVKYVANNLSINLSLFQSWDECRGEEVAGGYFRISSPQTLELR